MKYIINVILYMWYFLCFMFVILCHLDYIQVEITWYNPFFTETVEEYEI